VMSVFRPSPLILGVPYRLESVLSINEVQRAEQKPSLGFLVAFGPTLAQDIPLRLEVPTQLASESLLQCSQEYGHCVVPRRLGQLPIACIVELQWSAAGQRLRAEVLEAVARRFLGCKRGERQQRCCEKL
jgi:hypothetical protein